MSITISIIPVLLFIIAFGVWVCFGFIAEVLILAIHPGIALGIPLRTRQLYRLWGPLLFIATLYFFMEKRLSSKKK